MDQWDGGDSYEHFMGRWSRLVAARFVDRVKPADDRRWLDVGCGTGALLESIVQRAKPSYVAGVDLSQEYVETATASFGDEAEIRQASGDDLPFDDATFDVVVSGLVLNFMPDPASAVHEWGRVTRSGGTAAAYVWDYAEGMGFLRYFWDAAVGLDPEVRGLDEKIRFPLCQPDRLEELFVGSGLSDVHTGRIEVDTDFSSFEDLWAPFELGQGPAPGYVAGLGDDEKERLASRFEEMLPTDPSGAISLKARAWTVQGHR